MRERHLKYVCKGPGAVPAERRRLADSASAVPQREESTPGPQERVWPSQLGVTWTQTEHEHRPGYTNVQPPQSVEAAGQPALSRVTAEAWPQAARPAEEGHQGPCSWDHFLSESILSRAEPPPQTHPPLPAHPSTPQEVLSSTPLLSPGLPGCALPAGTEGPSGPAHPQGGSWTSAWGKQEDMRPLGDFTWEVPPALTWLSFKAALFRRVS